MPTVYLPHMTESERGLVLVVSSDLLGRTRIEEAVARSGFTHRAVGPGQLGRLDATGLRAVFADVDSDEVLEEIEGLGPREDVLQVGYYAHVDRARADRLKRAGWQAMPRGRLFRELPGLLQDL